MKRLESQLPIKVNCSTFCNLIAIILSWNGFKGLKVTQKFKKSKFEAVWGQNKIKKIFPEAITHKISETTVSCEIVDDGKRLISIIQKFSPTINKTFILARKLGAKLSVYEE